MGGKSWIQRTADNPLGLWYITRDYLEHLRQLDRELRRVQTLCRGLRDFLTKKVNTYDAVKALLIDRGWSIDASATEDQLGELHEFIHPRTGRRMPWITAVFAQQEIDEGIIK